ncbi:MAG: ATP-binding protein [Chloroflexi bacterium]|nr:ATP-binding protein [Chloroflexota bacterium]MBI5053991.1 ATP-binding protein [Chloroflexota bacterium]MBI5082585.1 ATP-binding protein [Chloroflexota bacterium]MBI5350458.1 ATP-binding protein [Chloroflexota bacterium]MBI5712872.1 ATP-binding protein [Chloroflexota bacterium]
MSESRLIVPARYDRIKQICSFVVDAANVAGLDESSTFQCQIAVDEACTNIIEHGYEGEDKGRIEVICNALPTVLKIELLDQAPPFDLDKVPEPELGAPLEDMKIGGLGIYFMKKMMDDVSFSRENGTNKLSLLKRRAG